MRVLSKEEFKQEKDIIRNKLKEENTVFIYPTDTIYGIGCNALNKEAVERIRKIKHRANNPFSVIAPSKEWIAENCEVNENAKEWIKKLPGPYTLVLKTKEECVAKNVAPGLKTLGIRIPDHWFSGFVKEISIPIVSTSVNISGGDFMTSLEDLDEGIKAKVDFIIYEGPRQGKPSKIVDLTSKVKVIER
ncbi:threonylcarbamoyl-AMP synthase [Candidatus Woesearchaeota archaeon]|nr:threonylcarbamoyl-AMP synthase [Candidatus Woesearchaeota archaeon]